MTTTVHTRGYSEFFASGIRVVSRRFASPRFDAVKPIPLAFDSANAGADSTKFTAKRPTSMIITLPNSAIIAGHPKAQQRQRRSSLISFSSRLFGRKPQSIPNEESGWVSSATDSTSSLHNSPEFWDMGGSPGALWSLPSCPNGGIEQPQPLDPFSPSPSSKSFFVDLQDSPKRSGSLSSTSSSSSSSFFSRKRDSFLHITSTPPPDASFLHFPRIRRSKDHGQDSNDHIRERPVSIHNIPILSSSKATTMTTSPNATTTTTAPPPSSDTRSARSQSNIRTRSREPSFLSKSSSISVVIPEDTNHVKNSKDTTISSSSVEEEPIINVIAEEEAPVSATDAHIFFSRDDDVPASVDWRQFHIELLADSS